MPDRDLSELPDDIVVPENSIASSQLYRRMYTVVCDDELFEELCSLSEQRKTIDSLYSETELQPLIDAGLAVRRSGETEPYVDITNVGQTFVEEGPEDGIRVVVNEEEEFKKKY